MRPRHGALEAVREQDTVRQPGQRIVEGPTGEPLLQGIALGNVAGCGERKPSSGDLPEEADLDLDGEYRAVLAPVGSFRGAGLPACEPAPQPGDTLGQQDRPDVRHGVGEQLLPRVTEALARPPVDVEDPAPGIVDEERVRSVFDNGPVSVQAARAPVADPPGYLSCGAAGGFSLAAGAGFRPRARAAGPVRLPARRPPARP